MKSKIYFVSALLVILFSINQKSIAQTPNWMWAKSVGGTGNDVCYGVAVDDSGYVYTTGTFDGTVDFDPGPGTFNLTSNGILDVFILKLDSVGSFVWAKSVGGSGTDAGYQLTVDGSGNIYITGRFNGQVDFDPDSGTNNVTSTGYMDIFVLKLRNTGGFNWVKTMGGTGDDEGLALKLDTLGNVYITGYFEGTVDFNPGAGIFNLTSKGGVDAFICKLELGGNFIWAVSFGGTFWDSGSSIAIDAASNVYTTGHYQGTVDFDPGNANFDMTSSGGDEIFISKLDETGKFIWSKSLGGNQTDWGMSVAADVSGNVYSTGNFRGVGDFNPGGPAYNLTSVGDHDIFVSGLDSAGNFNWAGSMGSTNPDFGYSIAVDAYNNIYTTGLFYGTVDFNPGTATFNLSSAGNNDIFISKLDSNGNFLWAKSVGGFQSDQGTSIAFDHYNHLILAGVFMSQDLVFGSDTLTHNGLTGITGDVYIAMLDSGINTTGIENAASTNNISVYPNPASDLLVISYPLTGNKEATITITDITGKIIYTITSATSKAEINIQNFNAGVYLVQIQSADFVATRKVIVTR